MTFLNKAIRFIKNISSAGFFIPFGIIMIVFGVILFSLKTDKYLETKGTIISVTESLMTSTDDEPQQQEYDIGVKYTVDGKEYNGEFSNLTGKYKVGDEIKVFYNPDKPENIANSKMGAVFAPIIICVGVILLLFGIFKTVVFFKKGRI